MDPINLASQWLCFIDPTNIVTRRQTQGLEVAKVQQGARELKIMLNFPSRRL